VAGVPTALLITDEECRVEDFDRAGLDLRTVATLATGTLRSPLPVAEAVLRFDEAALTDAAARIGADPVRLSAGAPDVLARWAAGAGARQIVTPYIPRGPLYDWMQDAAGPLAKHGITLTEWRRDWDSAIWPHATAGFFKVKQQIPRILEETRAAGQDPALPHGT
jgi:deoxyribodipyrimidine photo-lyase